MKTKISLVTLGLAIAAAPLAAQISPRGDGSSRTGGTARQRIETAQDVLDAARARAGIETGRTTSRDSHIPRGHLPPRGSCRVWIEGVPPGHQPPVTSCAEAERDRFRYSNASVIYGDQQSFPGKGKGKFKNVDGTRASQRECSIWDRVVVNGRVESVCRDGSIYDNRTDSRSVYGDDRTDDYQRRDAKSGKKVAKQTKKGGRKGSRG
jgi:hypothetical protein